ncbi:Hsp70 family protein [Pseudoalteromonas sp. SWYJZ12]|nr:Hsp70 family protein [Pseudoalteromonas sp. SWYJZ12]
MALNYKRLPYQTQWVEYPDIGKVGQEIGAKPTTPNPDGSGTLLWTCPMIIDPNHLDADKGRLSKEEIERMVEEAEKYKAEDEAAASRITAKNGLESYAYNLRNSITDEKLADKFEAGDKAKLETAVNETISWLDASQEGSKEEYEEKQKELEAIANPIMQKLYGAAGGAPGGAPGGFPGGGAPGGFPGAGAGAHEDGPSVEEVD